MSLTEQRNGSMNGHVMRAEYETPLNTQRITSRETVSAPASERESIHDLSLKAIDERTEPQNTQDFSVDCTKGCGSMGLALEKEYTINDIYALPDGVRAELIDGKLYYMSSPTRTHQQLIRDLTFAIYDYLKEKKGLCEVYMAPFAVFLNNDCYTYVEPDISVICDSGKLDDRGCNGAPDWIIEIASPSSLSMDYNVKLFKYRTANVREYWIVDPMKHMITVYNFELDILERHSFSDTVKAGIYDDLYIDFSQMNH